ncbi:MAG: hypothetical protein AB8B83_05650 [Bdellovibrionales bacterium]
MSFVETWHDAQIRMLGEMAAISRQFEQHYGAHVVAAVLIQAKEQGKIPSDPQDFGALFKDVQPEPKIVDLDEHRVDQTLDHEQTPFYRAVG